MTLENGVGMFIFGVVCISIAATIIYFVFKNLDK